MPQGPPALPSPRGGGSNVFLHIKYSHTVVLGQILYIKKCILETSPFASHMSQAFKCSLLILLYKY